MRNANLEVLRIDSAKDVEKNFFFNSENGSFEFADKNYTGVVEITSNGAKALGDNWTRMFAGTKVSKVIAKDTSNVTDMSYMFCRSQATSLDLSNLDTSNITDMRGMFWESKATELDLSNFDTSNVTDMEGMFFHSEAAELDLSSFDTSKVTDMSHMFQGSKATYLDLSIFDTSNVVYMEDMLCESDATFIDLRSFDTPNVEDMGLTLDDLNIKEILVRLQSSSDMTLNVSKSNSFNKKDVAVESEDVDDVETIDKLIKLVLENVREEEISIDDGAEMLKYLFNTKTV